MYFSSSDPSPCVQHCDLRVMARACLGLAVIPTSLDLAVVSEVVKWQYRDSEDLAWKNMPTFYSDLHELNLKNNVAVFEYDVQYAKGTKNYHYRVCLESMTQTNENTNKIRRILRVVSTEVAT